MVSVARVVSPSAGAPAARAAAIAWCVAGRTTVQGVAVADHGSVVMVAGIPELAVVNSVALMVK